MKPSDLSGSMGTLLTPEEGMFFTVTVTFSDTLETEFQGVTKVTALSGGGYWLEQQDGTWNDIPVGFLYAAFLEVPRE